MEIIKWIADNVFGTPSILLGFIVFIGLLLQKKKPIKLSAAHLRRSSDS